MWISRMRGMKSVESVEVNAVFSRQHAAVGEEYVK